MELFGFFDVLVLASGKPWMLQVRSKMYPPTLQHPPDHKEQQQRMLHHRKSHIGIRDYAPYGCEWEGKEMIICPLLMSQKIHNAMSEHSDKEGQRRFVEHSGQGETGTHNDKRMHSNCNGMQGRVVQERMDVRHKRGLRHMFHIMRHKAQR